MVNKPITKFIEAEQSVANYARILGAIADAYLPTTPDHSHTNAAWNAAEDTLEARPIVLESGREITINYHPTEYHFHFKCSLGQILDGIVETKNKSRTAVLAELQRQLDDLGLDGSKFQKRLEFRFPALLPENDKPFIADKRDLFIFQKLRAGATEVLAQFLTEFELESEIRIWPHNFDTGIYCQHANGLEQYAGYSPADETASDVPYFYNSFYKDGKQVPTSGLADLSHGHWAGKDWQGAVLPMSDFPSYAQLLEAAPLFFRESSNAVI